MKITPDWSGCFAELRDGHFHGGLDFRTGEMEGQAIYAVADGIFINVTVSPTGYGRSIDIKHKNGIITRYGHLSAFIPKIEDEVIDTQYDNKSFRVSFKPKSVTNVKQGDLIGYSGNSGSSGGPHLHFEMRSENNIVFNPCLYGFTLKDSLAPVISQLAVYQVVDDGSLYNSEIRNLYNVVKKTHYSIKDTVKITSNKAFFGIESVDKIQGNRFKFGLHSLKMFIDDNLVFYWQLDTIYNWYARDINAFIDYFLYDSIGTKIQWTKKMPGNRLNFYKNCDNNGIFDFEENKTYKIRFEASDFNKNCSVLEFYLEKINKIEEGREIKNIFAYNEDNVFEDEDVSIKIPKYSFYENTVFNISKEDDSLFFSKKITFLKGIPSKKNYDLAMKTHIPKELQSKAIIVSMKKNGKISSVGGDFKDGYIHTSLNFFGTFAVTFDSTAPNVSIKNLKKDTICPQGEKIFITAFDELSGIGHYETKIDGKWALTEYDPKNKLLTINLKKHKLSRGIHRFQFSISDNKNNKTVKNLVIKF